VAKFDNGAPAVLEVPAGKGRVLVLASTWQPDDSQLALSTKFVPLLYALLEQSAGPPPVPAQYYVGDPVSLASVSTDSSANRAIMAPDGSSLKMAQGETNFSQTLTPGIYQLSSGGTNQPMRFAVNLDPSESRVTPVSLDEFERLGVPMATTSTSIAAETMRQAHFQNAELEKRQKLWRWLLIGTIIVLLTETWLAGRTARRSVQGGAAV
jgi:hypothetical protein